MFNLLRANWWSWNAARPTSFDIAYHWFNLAEAAAWFVIGALAISRFLKAGRLPHDIAYGAAFVCFGLTDIQEAFRLSTWLIVVKGGNLALLLALRDRIRQLRGAR